MKKNLIEKSIEELLTEEGLTVEVALAENDSDFGEDCIVTEGTVEAVLEAIKDSMQSSLPNGEKPHGVQIVVCETLNGEYFSKEELYNASIL